MILDTNVFVSALLVASGPPGAIYRAWADGAFTLLISEEQIGELRRTLTKPKLAGRIRPHQAGRLINNLKRLAENVGHLPQIKRSADPDDNFLLGMAVAGNADYLITGERSGLLVLIRHGRTRIISAREFVGRLT